MRLLDKYILKAFVGHSYLGFLLLLVFLLVQAHCLGLLNILLNMERHCCLLCKHLSWLYQVLLS